MRATLSHFFVTIITLLIPLSATAEETLFFKAYGKILSTPTLSSLKTELKDHEIKVLEPHDKQERTYVGFAMAELLNAKYGEAWKKADEILFTCRDGYQPSIPVERFLTKPAFLAHAEKGDPNFRVINKQQADQVVQLGPFYLVWDNRQDKELLAEGGTNWPYQVVGMDLINFADKFPKLAPPAKSSSAVKEGFLLFRRHCMTCHTLNGEGGTISHVDLNSPVSVTEYFKEPWLEKWIDNPAAMRPKTTMPPLPQDLPERQVKIKRIVAYLKAMNQGRR